MTLPKRMLGGSGVEVTELGMGGAPLGAIGARLTGEEADEDGKFECNEMWCNAM